MRIWGTISLSKLSAPDKKLAHPTKLASSQRKAMLHIFWSVRTSCTTFRFCWRYCSLNYTVLNEPVRWQSYWKKKWRFTLFKNHWLGSLGIHIPYIDIDTGIVFFGPYGHVGHYGPFNVCDTTKTIFWDLGLDICQNDNLTTVFKAKILCQKNVPIWFEFGLHQWKWKKVPQEVHKISLCFLKTLCRQEKY